MKKDLLENCQFAFNQTARFFVRKYFKEHVTDENNEQGWYWYRDFTSGIIQFKNSDRWYSLEDMLTYLGHDATKKQLFAYEEYCEDELEPLIFKIWKERVK